MRAADPEPFGAEPIWTQDVKDQWASSVRIPGSENGRRLRSHVLPQSRIRVIFTAENVLLQDVICALNLNAGIDFLP